MCYYFSSAVNLEKIWNNLEINTRFAGGVIASIEAGFNIPQIMIKDFLDYDLKELLNYKKIRMTRFYKETFYEINN